MTIENMSRLCAVILKGTVEVQNVPHTGVLVETSLCVPLACTPRTWSLTTMTEGMVLPIYARIFLLANEQRGFKT
jgi:hypothetical protein